MTADPERYVPAAGRFGVTALYDATVRLTMREDAWRPALADAAMAGARDGDVLDVGCGTGAVTQLLALAAPKARVTGIDGDSAVLARARRRLARCPRVTLLEGRADDLLENTGPPVGGELPGMLRGAGFARVAVTQRLGVVCGTLDLLCAALPPAG